MAGEDRWPDGKKGAAILNKDGRGIPNVKRAGLPQANAPGYQKVCNNVAGRCKIAKNIRTKAMMPARSYNMVADELTAAALICVNMRIASFCFYFVLIFQCARKELYKNIWEQ